MDRQHQTDLNRECVERMARRICDQEPYETYTNARKRAVIIAEEQDRRERVIQEFYTSTGVRPTFITLAD